MPSIEEMQKELEAAGWQLDEGQTGFARFVLVWSKGDIAVKQELSAFEREMYQERKTETLLELTPKAYAHLLKERQFEAMKALLGDEIKWASSPQTIHSLEHMDAMMSKRMFVLVDKARALFANKSL